MIIKPDYSIIFIVLLSNIIIILGNILLILIKLPRIPDFLVLGLISISIITILLEFTITSENIDDEIDKITEEVD